MVGNIICFILGATIGCLTMVFVQGATYNDNEEEK